MRACKPVLVSLAAVSLTWANAASQENVIGPPDILQFPVEASAEAEGELQIDDLRRSIEREVDLTLCEFLMRDANRWPPAEPCESPEGVVVPCQFAEAECLPEFKSKVAANSGAVHWESEGVRPTKCGSSCIGRPSLRRTDNVGRPNVRRTQLYGYLHLFVEPPGDHVPNNRSVTLPFEVFFECATTQGARDGVFKLDIDFGFPIIGDPGFWESVTNALLAPKNISARTESGLRRRFADLPDRTVTTFDCASIGAVQAANPTEDRATFDLPAPKRPGPRPPVAALRDQATIEFLRIKRNPLPPLVPPEVARPGDPAAGQFTVFLNGLERFLPPEGLALPPSGGSVDINYCTTIDMTGADRFQLIFASDLGGSVWSQFYPTESFGSGQVRTMTTGRTVVVPGTPTFDPVTGQTRPAKPVAQLLTEFELLYRITYTPRPDTATRPPTEATGGARPGLHGVIGVRPGDRPSVAVDPTQPTPEPCRRF